MKHVLGIVALALLSHTAAFAQSKVEIKAEDTPGTLLPKLIGQKVELHLKNGGKFSGKLESATAGAVHLSNLTGQEFFDVVIVAGEISAVVVRVR